MPAVTREMVAVQARMAVKEKKVGREKRERLVETVETDKLVLMERRETKAAQAKTSIQTL